MNNNRSALTTGLIIFAGIVVVVVITLLVNSLVLKKDAPAPTSTSLPLPTFTPDPCSPENVKPIALEINRHARAFDDLSVLAQNTPRENLAPIISQLQDIRRQAEDFVGPACVAKLQEYQLSYMNMFINTLVGLYSSLTTQLTDNDVNMINQGMAQAVEYHNQYLIELARLLGVTLAPTVTAPPAVVPATATP